jgi:hypothetical protein
MSRLKADLSLVSLNQLCTLTGKTSRTLKKLLAEMPPKSTESGTLWYAPAEALPVIYGVDLVTRRLGEMMESGDTEMLDPMLQKARFDKLRADKVALEIEQIKKNLIPRDKVEASWVKLVSNLRTAIMNFPNHVAPKVCQVKTIPETQKVLKTECHELLKELSEYRDGIDRSGADAKSS